VFIAHLLDTVPVVALVEGEVIQSVLVSYVVVFRKVAKGCERGAPFPDPFFLFFFFESLIAPSHPPAGVTLKISLWGVGYSVNSQSSVAFQAGTKPTRVGL